MNQEQILAYLASGHAFALIQKNDDLAEVMEASFRAVQKTIPAKPLIDELGLNVCPVCNLILLPENNYCSLCGQKIDRTGMKLEG